ncbi:MAG: polysaccharide pyruvyl transferase family protein [Oscillospiraceae bacterium]|nr:polysaccharide pyruvyl transferase family protein [Oscillospiraceae bacterium]
MKLDIITLQAVQNYGSVLQAYATQEIFRQHGCDVTIINYIRENVRPENLLHTWSKGNPIKKLVMLPTVRRWEKVFGGFNAKYLNLTDKVYTTEEDFKNYPLDADIYCTGSDQVWNSKWNRGIIPPLYLSFVPEDCFKFAFSASFGQDKLDQQEIDATRKYIHQYQFISVRESSAKTIIEEQYGYPEAVHILDPTLAMPPEFWRKHTGQPRIKEPYILIYNLNRSREFNRYAVKLAKKTGMKLIRFCTRYDQIFQSGQSMLVPEVTDFINLIANANYVLTDSFHATAFSMNLNTHPLCVYPPAFGGRLKSFLTLTDSLQCHVKNYEDFDAPNRAVDFQKVNLILDKERQKVNDFIEKVLTAASER